MVDEVWKAVVGFEGLYEISDHGNIRKIAPDRMGRKTHVGKLIKPMMGARGYYIYSFWKDGKPHSKLIHSLIMKAFCGDREDGETINHKNGIKTDNRFSNLEYVPHSENYRHALDVLGFKPPRGEKHHMAKLTDEQVIEIVKRGRNGEKKRHLAREFGIGEAAVGQYIAGKSRARFLTIPSE